MGEKDDALPWLVPGIIVCLVGIGMIIEDATSSQYCNHFSKKDSSRGM
jgi:hypothetical protein